MVSGRVLSVLMPRPVMAAMSRLFTVVVLAERVNVEKRGCGVTAAV